MASLAGMVVALGCLWFSHHVLGLVDIVSDNISGNVIGLGLGTLLRFLLYRYWRLVDPTDAGGQFCDRGPSYRTAIFVDGPDQRAAAEKSKAAVVAKLKGKTVVTPILALGPFWPAEPGHRNYAKRNPANYAIYRMGCGRDARLKQVWSGK